MNSDQLFTLLLVLTGLVVMICLACMWHADHDAYLGRALRKAAGSESAARMAIESANLDRLLSEKYEGELDRAKRRQGNRLPANVVRLVPRILNRGKPMHFEPPGAA